MSLLTVNERNYWVWLALKKKASELKSEGFVTRLNKLIGTKERVRVDLFAERGGRKAVYLFRTSKDTEREAKRFGVIQRVIEAEGGFDFHLLWIPVPNAPSIYVKNLEARLSMCIGENLGELDELSTHTTVTEVAELEIDALEIDVGEIHVRGAGTVYLDLQYGSGSDVNAGLGSVERESFPFNFEVCMNANLEIVRVIELAFDTSSFYR